MTAPPVAARMARFDHSLHAARFSHSIGYELHRLGGKGWARFTRLASLATDCLPPELWGLAEEPYASVVEPIGFAAVGVSFDGVTRVVHGVGTCPADALADARNQEAPEALDVVTITDGQERRIHDGECRCVELGIS